MKVIGVLAEYIFYAVKVKLQINPIVDVTGVIN